MIEVDNYYLKQKRKYYFIVLDYAAYIGVQGWRKGGRTRFPPVWPVFEIALVQGKSELVEFVGFVLYSAAKGFRPAVTFALKANISCFELI